MNYSRKIFLIKSIKIDDEPNKKIEIYLSPLKEEYIFWGLYKFKNNWEVFSETIISFEKEDLDLDFEKTVDEVHKKMNERIDFMELSKNYLKDIDSVSITKK